MSHPADDDSLSRARARAQLLGGGRRGKTAEDVVRRVFAIQAQDTTAADLGIRARGQDLTAQAVRAAYEQDRTVVRNWFMRGTLHTIPADDVGWVTRLLAPRVLAATRHRYRDLGLTDELRHRADALIGQALAVHGPLTRAELAERLAVIGVDLTGQAPFHLIRHAALGGLLCHGPLRAGEPTYVLLEDWLPAAGERGPTEDAAVAELARRYLAAYAPATVDDFASWSGLAVGSARRAWRDLAQAAAIVTDGDVTVLARRPEETGDQVASPDVRLLPAYDNYLTGYRTRQESVDAAFEARVWPGGGVIRPTVLVDGQVVGTWSRGPGGRAIAVDPFSPLAGPVQVEVDRESAAITRFLHPPPVSTMAQ
ncbi:winged helix DNA-binding domain-containing protein [Catellatospora paridis]|uniref:winged helix DNA-binding domain-containing protein n=1 Tax=Catellatospora paridis TaxID=1617086 RepID=UPI0012D4723B|nr:winged helix DNA-binding domain-containing protein [Catellatospora paridis]